jgi:hypothetical protein
VFIGKAPGTGILIVGQMFGSGTHDYKSTHSPAVKIILVYYLGPTSSPRYLLSSMIIVIIHFDIVARAAQNNCHFTYYSQENASVVSTSV